MGDAEQLSRASSIAQQTPSAMGFLSSLPGMAPAVDACVAHLGVPEEYAEYIPYVIIAVLAYVFVKALSAVLSQRDSYKKTVGDAVVLAGCRQTGKTALLYRLYANTFPRTVTSQEVAEKTFAPHADAIGEDEVARIGKRRFVDFPGHERLRPQLSKYVKQARCVVFLINASTVDAKTIRSSADFMYDLFTECIRANCEPSVLVACNMSDVEGAKTPKDIKKLLEDEMDQLKTTRHSLETVDDEDGDEIILGADGVKFDFDADAGCEVDFCACSVREGSLDEVACFVADAYAK